MNTLNNSYILKFACLVTLTLPSLVVGAQRMYTRCLHLATPFASRIRIIRQMSSCPTAPGGEHDALAKQMIESLSLEDLLKPVEIFLQIMKPKTDFSIDNFMRNHVLATKKSSDILYALFCEIYHQKRLKGTKNLDHAKLRSSFERQHLLKIKQLEKEYTITKKGDDYVFTVAVPRRTRLDELTKYLGTRSLN